MPCSQVDIGLLARIDTQAEYVIRGWLCNYYTLDHLNRFICEKYLVVFERVAPVTDRHVYLRDRPNNASAMKSSAAFCIGIHTLKRRNYNFYFQFMAAFAYNH